MVGHREQGTRMGRGRHSTLDAIAALPWPVGLALGILGFALIRYGAPAWLAGRGGMFGEAFANNTHFFALFAWIVLAACTMASGASYLGARRRRRLLDTRTDLDSIAALGWRDFERLVGEAFRRRGYTVEETGLGGADGGIDLILSRDGQRTLVQCKHWKRERVPVNVVREMYGLLAHHKAHAVQIAAMGGFTRDSERFAEGKPIALMDGKTLLSMIREVQGTPSHPSSASAAVEATPTLAGTSGSGPPCPRCAAPTVLRRNRQRDSVFWGCSRFPTCRGTEATQSIKVSEHV